MKSTQQFLPALALTLYGAFASAADDHPGFVDFSALRGLADAEPVVEVTLREPLLRLITETIPEEDTEAANFVSRLLNVRLQVYEELEGDVRQVAESMEAIAANLEDEAWERVVRVRDDGDHVDIFLRFSSDEEVIYGIALMVVSDDGEVVLGNIAGNISADDIAALGRRFDIDELEDFHEQIGDNGAY